MVMENEGRPSALESTSWTSTVPHPFSRAPGAGVGDFDTGFAAEEVVPAAQQIHPDHLVLAEKFRISVTRKEAPGVPSMVVSLRYTDKGTLTKSALDKHIQQLLKKSDFRVSANTLWQPTPVTWRWEQGGGDYYFPVVASGPLAGTRYAGNAIELPVYTPTDALLTQLPSTMQIYTIALTSKDWSLDDADAARALTLIKQGVVNMQRYNAYLNIAAVVRGVETSVFTGNAAAPPETPLPSGDGEAPIMQAGMGMGLGALLLGGLALLLLSNREDEEMAP